MEYINKSNELTHPNTKSLKIKEECLSDGEEDLIIHEAEEEVDIKIEYDPLTIKNEPPEPFENENSELLICSGESSDFDPSQPRFKCQLCSYETVDATYLPVHKKTHKDKHRCDSCYYICGSASKLFYHRKKRHMKIEDLLFYCGDCSFTSLVKKHLVVHRRQEHKRVCYQEKKNLCPKCPFKTSSKLTLVRHQNKVHNDPLFKCLMCPRAYIHEEEHTDHMLSHSFDFRMWRFGIYKCKLCDFSTKNQQVIMEHNKNLHKVTEEREMPLINE